MKLNFVSDATGIESAVWIDTISGKQHHIVMMPCMDQWWLYVDSERIGHEFRSRRAAIGAARKALRSHSHHRSLIIATTMLLVAVAVGGYVWSGVGQRFHSFKLWHAVQTTPQSTTVRSNETKQEQNRRRMKDLRPFD